MMTRIGAPWTAIRARAPIALLAAVAMLGCPGDTMPPSDAHQPGVYSPPFYLQGEMNAWAAIARNWSVNKEEPNDMQMIRDDNDDKKYAHLVRAIPATDIGKFDDATFTADSGIAVGLVFVDPGNPAPLPQHWQQRNVQRGWNCIYLRNPATGWVGWSVPMGPPPAGGKCPHSTEDTHNPNKNLLVTPVTVNGFGPGDYPPVARLHEGSKGSGGNKKVSVHFGFRCGPHWCYVYPGGVTPEASQLSTVVGHNGEREWKVPGWADEQTLAVRDLNNDLTPGGPHVAVIPSKDVNTLSWANIKDGNFHALATIYLFGTQAAVYKTWPLTPGENVVYFKADVAGADPVKSYIVPGAGSPQGSVPVGVVTRYDHSAPGEPPVPGTARFAWLPFDEDVWVRCDQGCCMVSGDCGGEVCLAGRKAAKLRADSAAAAWHVKAMQDDE